MGLLFTVYGLQFTGDYFYRQNRRMASNATIGRMASNATIGRMALISSIAGMALMASISGSACKVINCKP